MALHPRHLPPLNRARANSLYYRLDKAPSARRAPTRLLSSEKFFKKALDGWAILCYLIPMMNDMKLQAGTLYFNTDTNRVERLSSVISCTGQAWTYHHDEQLEKVKLADLAKADGTQVRQYLGK